MSDINSVITTLHTKLGAAEGSLIYSNTAVNFDNMRALMQANKLRIVACAVSKEVHAAAAQLFGLLNFNGDQVSLKEGDLADYPITIAVETAIDREKHDTIYRNAFAHGLLYKVSITLTIQGDKITRSFYVVRAGQGGKPAAQKPMRPSDAFQAGGFRQGEVPVVSAKTPAHRKGAAMGKSISPELQAEMRRQARPAKPVKEYPVMDTEPEPDNGRPRKRGGNKNKGKSDSRNDKRFK